MLTITVEPQAKQCGRLYNKRQKTQFNSRHPRIAGRSRTSTDGRRPHQDDGGKESNWWSGTEFNSRQEMLVT